MYGRPGSRGRESKERHKERVHQRGGVIGRREMMEGGRESDPKERQRLRESEKDKERGKERAAPKK